MAARRAFRLAFWGVAATLVASAAFLVWATAIRTPALDEVLAREPWQAGDVEVEGTIAKVTPLAGGAGAVVLDLEPTVWGRLAGFPDGGCTQVFAPAGTYEVGTRHRTTLHFSEVHVNGAPAVTAPELACPFPAMGHAVAVVLEAVGYVQGGVLRYIGEDAEGAARFEVLTSHGQRLPAADVPAWLGREVGTGTPLVSLEAWTQESAATFVLVTKLTTSKPGETVRTEPGDAAVMGGVDGAPSGNSFETVDQLGSLAASASSADRLRFHDVDGDGMVGDGDVVSLRIETPPATYQRYVLRLGDCSVECVAGSALFVAGPDGVLPWTVSEESAAFQLILDGPIGTVAHLRVGKPLGPAPPLENVRVEVLVDGARLVEARLRDGELASQPRVVFVDANGNGLVDQGDWLTVDASGHVEVRLFEETTNTQVTQLAWASPGT